jgi:hypothetical protein
LGTFKQIGIGVIIGLIVDGLVLGVPFVLSVFGIVSPLNLLMTQFPIWITLLAVIILVPSIIMLLRPKSRGISVAVVRNRPEGNVFTITYYYAGVKWRVLYGRARSYTRSEPYAFCEPHPQCPECDYEMETEKKGILLKNYHWKCDRCGTFYKCPKNHPYDAYEVVERLVEADIRTGRLKLQDS